MRRLVSVNHHPPLLILREISGTVWTMCSQHISELQQALKIFLLGTYVRLGQTDGIRDCAFL